MNEDPRRKSTRIKLNIIVAFDDGEAMSGTFCRNISEKGFFLESVTHVEIGRHLNITFRLPNRNTALQLEGIVRWRQAATAEEVPGIGIEFQNLSEEQSRALRDELDIFVKAV